MWTRFNSWAVAHIVAVAHKSLGNVSVFTLIFLNVWINDPGEVQEQKSSVQTHSTVTVTGDLHHRLSLISFIVFFFFS